MLKTIEFKQDGCLFNKLNYSVLRDLDMDNIETDLRCNVEKVVIGPPIWPFIRADYRDGRKEFITLKTLFKE